MPSRVLASAGAMMRSIADHFNFRPMDFSERCLLLEMEVLENKKIIT